MEYTITSRKNPGILHVRRLGSDREYRRESGEFVCCGKKLLQEALANGAEIRAVFRTPEEAEGMCPAGVPEFLVPEDVLASSSPFRTSPGVLFTCAIPKEGEKTLAGGEVILETVQDPGNVGTVLRTANAFGVPAVVLTGDCADVYNPKAVRASMGAVFRETVVSMTLEELRAESGRVRILGAALGEGCTDVRKTDLTGAAVAIGSEGHGLSPALLELCCGRIRIPMRPECESLNAAAAAAVVLWEMRRELL